METLAAARSLLGHTVSSINLKYSAKHFERSEVIMAVIRKLNYQHLLYFWSVVRTGSLTRACEELALSAPTISSQLRTLEARLGETLLTKSGRKLVPTEVGRLVYGYADEIFGLGQDLLEALEHRPTAR